MTSSKSVKPLIIGEAPGRGKDAVGGMFPLSGAVGVRLTQLAGLEEQALQDQPGTSRYGHYYWTLRKYFDLDNLLDYWPGSSGKGSAFPPKEAYGAVINRRDEWQGRTIVLLGRRLLSAFGLGIPFYTWDTSEGAEELGIDPPFWHWLVGIPHPSGLTRNYNDPAERERAGKVLREARERVRC